MTVASIRENLVMVALKNVNDKVSAHGNDNSIMCSQEEWWTGHFIPACGGKLAIKQLLQRRFCLRIRRRASFLGIVHSFSNSLNPKPELQSINPKKIALRGKEEGRSRGKSEYLVLRRRIQCGHMVARSRPLNARCWIEMEQTIHQNQRKTSSISRSLSKPSRHKTKTGLYDGVSRWNFATFWAIQAADSRDSRGIRHHAAVYRKRCIPKTVTAPKADNIFTIYRLLMYKWNTLVDIVGFRYTDAFGYASLLGN
jgi:hypothetical protein